jgi:hypothetical protein
VNYYCDACKRVNSQEITQLQLETGELVASRNGQNLRPRHRELFVLCAQCSEYSLNFLRSFIACGGTAGIEAAQVANRPVRQAS